MSDETREVNCEVVIVRQLAVNFATKQVCPASSTADGSGHYREEKFCKSKV